MSKINRKITDSAMPYGIEQVSAIIKRHKQMVAELEDKGSEKILAIAKAIVKSARKGGCVYTCGNGGSAADAQHIAAELVGRFEKDRKALPAVSLTTDTSLITSVANDYGYENIFARQVDALVKKGDILWAISTSGSSANVVSAAKAAKNKGAFVIAFTGRAASPLEKHSDICLCAEDKLTARSQEIHQLAYHIICAIVEKEFAT
jgi:D-sedoheptulose 7-phosphate isomerase